MQTRPPLIVVVEVLYLLQHLHFLHHKPQSTVRPKQPQEKEIQVAGDVGASTTEGHTPEDCPEEPLEGIRAAEATQEELRDVVGWGHGGLEAEGGHVSCAQFCRVCAPTPDEGPEEAEDQECQEDQVGHADGRKEAHGGEHTGDLFGKKLSLKLSLPPSPPIHIPVPQGARGCSHPTLRH